MILFGVDVQHRHVQVAQVDRAPADVERAALDRVSQLAGRHDPEDDADEDRHPRLAEQDDGEDRDDGSRGERPAG